MDEERVAGEDRPAELHLVRTHEVADLPAVLGLAHHHDGCDLGHGLHLKDAGHDRMSGEMSLEEGFVDRHAFDADRLVVAVELDDPVDHQEGIAVRQDPHHPVDVEDGRGRGHGFGCLRKKVAAALGNGPRQFRVGSVTRLHRHDVAAQRAPGERKVADDVEDLVTDELVLKA